jgi:hypothetical protein
LNGGRLDELISDCAVQNMFEIAQLKVNSPRRKRGPSAGVPRGEPPVRIPLDIRFAEVCQRDTRKIFFKLYDRFEFRANSPLGFGRQIALNVLLQVVGKQELLIAKAILGNGLPPFVVGLPSAEFGLRHAGANTP